MRDVTTFEPGDRVIAAGHRSRLQAAGKLVADLLVCWEYPMRACSMANEWG